MGHKTETIETAKLFYVIEKKDVNEIANIMGIPVKTLYNWIKKNGWDEHRQNSGSLSLALDIEKQFHLDIQKAMADKKLTDPATADALWKTAKIIEKLTPKKMLLSNIFTFLKDTVDYFIANENDDVVLTKLHGHMSRLADYLRRKYAGDA